MNTLDQTRFDLLKPTGRKNNVILLENLEFGMSRSQLNQITDLHNSGMRFEEISKKVERDPYEVVLALLHQARTNNVRLRPFVYRM